MLPIVNPYRDGLDRPAGPEGTFKAKSKKAGGGVPSRIAFLVMLVCIVGGTYYLHLKYFASTIHKPSVRGSANTYRSFSDSVKDFAVDMQHDLQKLDEKKNPPDVAIIDLKKPTDPSVQRSGKINTFTPEPKDTAKVTLRTVDKKATAKPEQQPKNLGTQDKAPRVIKRAETLTPDLMNRLQSENQFANAVEDKVLSLAAQAKDIKSKEAAISNARLAKELTPQQQQQQEKDRQQQQEQDRLVKQRAQQELEQQQQLRQQQEQQLAQQQAQQQEQERQAQLQHQQELDQQQEEQHRQDLQRQQELEAQQAQLRRQRQEQEDQLLLQQHQQEEQQRMRDTQGRPRSLDLPPEDQHNAAAAEQEEPPLLGPVVLREEEEQREPADPSLERPAVVQDADQPPSVGAQEAATVEEQRPAEEGAAPPPVEREPEEPVPQAAAQQDGIADGNAEAEAPPPAVEMDFPGDAPPTSEGGALQALVRDRDVVPTAEVQSENQAAEPVIPEVPLQAAAPAEPASEALGDAHPDALPAAGGDSAPLSAETPAVGSQDAAQVAAAAKELADIPEFVSLPAEVPHLDPPAALASKDEVAPPVLAAAAAEPPVPPVIVTTTANNRPTGYDLPDDLKIPANKAAAPAEAAPGEKIDYCAGQVDPFRGTPVDTFQPPAGADFELAAQWHSAVRSMVSKISKVKYGGEELRALIRTEVEALQVMRFKMFCQYA